MILLAEFVVVVDDVVVVVVVVVVVLSAGVPFVMTESREYKSMVLSSFSFLGYST